MAVAGKPPLVKLICGMISADETLFGRADAMLVEEFGPIDIASETMNFDFTHYYDSQMGSPLLRRFVAFQRLVEPDRIAPAKVATNRMEQQIADSCGGANRPTRPINLDPGYIESSKLVLASMKNFSHRIYLGSGVYAEVTLMYHKGRWDALGWTFPDYGSGRYDSFLTEARRLLRQQAQQEDKT